MSKNLASLPMRGWLHIYDEKGLITISPKDIKELYINSTEDNDKISIQIIAKNTKAL